MTRTVERLTAEYDESRGGYGPDRGSGQWGRVGAMGSRLYFCCFDRGVGLMRIDRLSGMLKQLD